MLFESELWTKDVQTLRGDMFIHTFWDGERQTWMTGVGYWCRDGGWAGSEVGRTGREHLATHFHPFPTPPRV